MAAVEITEVQRDVRDILRKQNQQLRGRRDCRARAARGFALGVSAQTGRPWQRGQVGSGEEVDSSV